MDFIRNKEVKRQIVVSSILILFGAALALSLIAKLCGLFCRLSFHPVQFPSFHISEIQENC